MLPQWLVNVRTTHHTSTRQPKRVRPDWIKQQYRHFPERRNLHGARAPMQQYVTNSTKLKPSQTGPLNLNEYRFWRSSDGIGRCRHCWHAYRTPEDRKAHQKEFGCTRVLTEAYKLLLRDEICVVCDTKTDKTLWGVPLCSNTCVFRWQFEAGAGTYAVQLAIGLYNNQTGNKPVVL